MASSILRMSKVSGYPFGSVAHLGHLGSPGVYGPTWVDAHLCDTRCGDYFLGAKIQGGGPLFLQGDLENSARVCQSGSRAIGTLFALRRKVNMITCGKVNK